jgi:hypothetical protein
MPDTPFHALIHPERNAHRIEQTMPYHRSCISNATNLGVEVHQVQIEVILLSLWEDTLNWRVVQGDLPSGSSPDTHARELAGLGATVPTGTVVHSTSWRPAPGGVILTYAVAPDPVPTMGPLHAVPADARIICSADAAAPTPPVVAVEHVLAHALRHLSMVARTSPAVAEAVDACPQLWDAVLAHTPDVAGQLVST